MVYPVDDNLSDKQVSEQKQFEIIIPISAKEVIWPKFKSESYATSNIDVSVI